MEKKKDKHEQIIKEAIDKAQYQAVEQKRDLLISADDYSGDFKREAKDVIERIKQANEDINYIEFSHDDTLRMVNQKVNRILLEIFGVMNRIAIGKENKIKELKELSYKLILAFGNKLDSMLLLLHVKRREFPYLFRHSVNVFIISIAIAVELTKMMTLKLNDESSKGDFKVLTSSNNKIFDEYELTNLAASAFLHDVGLMESMPEMNENTRITIKNRSKVDMHPNDAFHLLTSLKTDYEIRKAVFQHHERIDGSGYPNSIKKLFFNKYSLVLSFANTLELMTTRNPFSKKFHPHNAIMHILTKERLKFDNDVILAYCRAASLYPIGSWLILSNKRIGLVFKSNKTNFKRPIIKCIYTAEMKELLQKEFVDLSQSNLKIMELVDIESLELLNKNIESYFLDEREFKRVNVSIEGAIQISQTEKSLPVMIKDLSAGGLRMEYAKYLKMGDKIYLNFEYKGKALSKIKGLVVWSHTGSKQYGIRFISIDQKSREFLLESI